MIRGTSAIAEAEKSFIATSLGAAQDGARGSESDARVQDPVRRAHPRLTIFDNRLIVVVLSASVSGSSLKILVLGGTAWLGGQLCREALNRGHTVWCLARGRSGFAPEGARLVGADRRSQNAYDEVCDRDWDAVIDVTWQPGWVRSALAALHERVGQWIYVSSASVYASHAERGADETSELLAPTDLDEVGMDLYGPSEGRLRARVPIQRGLECIDRQIGLDRRAW